MDTLIRTCKLGRCTSSVILFLPLHLIAKLSGPLTRHNMEKQIWLDLFTELPN